MIEQPEQHIKDTSFPDDVKERALDLLDEWEWGASATPKVAAAAALYWSNMMVDGINQNVVAVRFGVSDSSIRKHKDDLVADVGEKRLHEIRAP